MKITVCDPIESRSCLVSFDYIAEGFNGDYDPDDPSDKPLLRLDVLVNPAFYTGSYEIDPESPWVCPDDSTICTQLSGHSNSETQQRFLENALDWLSCAVESGLSIKPTMGAISGWSARGANS